MKNAENYILKDEETDLSSSDESMDLFNGDQNNSLDDELQQLLGEAFTSEANNSAADDSEVMINTEYGSSPVEDENAVSALQELEELYGVSGDSDASLPADESTSEDVSDVSSLMEEMAALYGDSDETEIDDSGSIDKTEEPANEDTFDSASLMEEMEALYGGSAETQIDDSSIVVETDGSENEETSEGISLMEELEKLFSRSNESAETEFSAEPSEQFSAEEDSSSLSALDELKAFLGESTQDEVANTETSSASTLEDSYASRRSVLDELETLLQSCITELKTDAENTTSDASVFADAEYPSRDELQNLLENVLSQLMLFTDSTVATTSTDDVSVLDELKNFMDQTGAADKAEASTESESLFADNDFAESYKSELYESEVNEDETEFSSMSDYVAAEGMAVENGDAEDAATENIGTDSIIDELNLLLGNSDAASDAETETFDTALESDYSTSGISDETPALDEPVQDELDTYMAGLSRDIDAADETSVEETAVDTSGTEPVSSSSNTIEELEAMLNEINSSASDTSDNDKTSDDLIANADDFSYEIETRQSSTDAVVDEIEAENSEAYNIEANVSVTHAPAAKTPEVNTSTTNVNLLHKQDNNGRLPIVGLLFAAALAIGIYSIWNLLDTDNKIDDRSAKTRVNRTYKPVAVPEEPKTSTWSEPSVTENRAAQRWQPDIEEASVSVISTETDSIYSLPEEAETSSYVPISSYEDEPLTIENTEPAFENKVTQTQRIEGVYIESENRLKEMIGLQIEKLQQENKSSIEQLNRRMTEAELENKTAQTQRIEGAYIESENRLKEMIGSQIEKLQQENKNSLEQVNKRITEAELKNKATQTQRVEGVYIESDNRLKEMVGLQVEKLQQQNSNSIKQLNRRMTKAEAAIVRLQEEKTIAKQQDIIEPVKPAPFEVPEKPELPVKQERIELSIQKAQVNTVPAKDSSLWSVHLSAYYREPPPAAELQYLGKAGISYEIKKAIVNDQVWYRVIVDEFSEYEKAKAYSKAIRKKVGRKDIWISRTQ